LANGEFKRVIGEIDDIDPKKVKRPRRPDQGTPAARTRFTLPWWSEKPRTE
jgi:hypothetical protein